jgi:hypothetical protein
MPAGEMPSIGANCSASSAGGAGRHRAQRRQPVIVLEAFAPFARFDPAHAGHQVAGQAPVGGGGAAQFLEMQSEHVMGRRRVVAARSSGLDQGPAFGHVKRDHHAAQRMQDRADHRFFGIAHLRTGGQLLRHHPGQHGFFHLDVRDLGVRRAAPEFLDQFQAQCQVADAFGAQHQHGPGNRVDVLAERRVHAAVGQAQDLLGQHGVGQDGLRHREFALVLAAHRRQDGIDGLGKAGHVALAANAFPQQGESGLRFRRARGGDWCGHDFPVRVSAGRSAV